MILSPWAVNRSPELWGSNAEDFIPERWIDNAYSVDPTMPPKPNNHGGAESNYALLTFLHGPRSCIGQTFAKAEMRCLVAAFVDKFEWDLDMKGKEVLASGTITIKPKNGLHARLRRVYR
jgi:cytochrome P450